MKPTRPVVVITFSDGIEGAHLQLLKDEKTVLENTLWDLHTKELIEVYKEESLSRQELIDLLPRFQHNRIVIFHYAGHAGSTGIHTEGGEARAEGLAALLGQEKALQLVVLNGCSTIEQVKGLKEKGVKAVIATSSKVGDEVAKNFAAIFYKQLAKGYALKPAFDYAIASIQTEKPIKSNVVPMRSIEIDEGEPDDIPWDLYYHEDHKEILEWKLPSPADPKEKIDPDIYKDPEELQSLSFAEKKEHLLKVLDNDIDRIIPDLDTLLAGESSHRETVRLLNGQLNDYYRNKYSGAVEPEGLEAELKRIKLKLMHLISLLEKKDFVTEAQGYPRSDSVQAPVENVKKGGIWRKIPQKMKVNKPIECKIKIAVDKGQLEQESAESNIKIRIDTIRTSSEMEVDLFEPPLGPSPAFDIKFLGSKKQLVDIDAPTEWTFYVTPLKEGTHKLLLHVTVVEERNDKELVKVIPFEDEIEIVAYETEELGVYEKKAVLNFLPAVPLGAAGKGKESTEEAIGEKAALEPATASTGMGIGKIVAGIVTIAAVAALAWWGLQGNSGENELTRQEEPITNETPVEPENNPPVQPPELGGVEKVPPSLANSNFNYEMIVDDNLAIPFENLVEGGYSEEYTFTITKGENSEQLTMVAATNALNLKALKAGSHTIDFQICNGPEKCSAGSIKVNIKDKKVEAPVDPPKPEFEYGTVKGVSKTYNTVKIEDTWWTRQNLNEPGGYCYGSNDSNCNNYGALYYWNLANEACQKLNPGKWSLPKPNDWNKIKNSTKYKNALNLKKGGYVSNDGTSQSLQMVGLYWSVSGLGFEYFENGISQKPTSNDYQLSCRCVQN